jgi:hypothetical protein
VYLIAKKLPAEMGKKPNYKLTGPTATVFI